MASDVPPAYEPVEKEEDQEIVIDLEDNTVSEALSADPDMIKIRFSIMAPNPAYSCVCGVV